MKMRAIAYRLPFLPSFSFVHSMFHICMLHKYLYDPSYILEPQTIEFQKDMSYKVKSKIIMD